MIKAGTTAKDATDKMAGQSPKSEAFEESGADAIVVIPVNNESKKIRQILSNDTSMKIMELLKKENLSASEISERLEIPLTTVKYNVDQMVEYDLVRIQRIKYSEKGRQVKIYEAPEKVIVFAPESISRVSLFSMLQKYAFAFLATAFAGFGLSNIFQRYWATQEPMMRAWDGDPAGGGYYTGDAAAMGIPPADPDSIVPPSEPGVVPVPPAPEVPAEPPMPPVEPPMPPQPPVPPQPPMPPSDPPAEVGTGADYMAEVISEIPPSDVTFFHSTVMSFSDWFFYIMNYHVTWFIAGALFVCIAIWTIEYINVKKNENRNE